MPYTYPEGWAEDQDGWAGQPGAGLLEQHPWQVQDQREAERPRWVQGKEENVVKSEDSQDSQGFSDYDQVEENEHQQKHQHDLWQSKVDDHVQHVSQASHDGERGQDR